MRFNHVYLTGMLGVGKTTLGPLLATPLNGHSIDLDHWIEQSQSQSISDLFKNQGEAFFRELETQTFITLHEKLKELPCIWSLGGGFVLSKKNRLLLQRDLTSSLWIYLKASPEVLSQRLSQSQATHRPSALLKNTHPSTLRALLQMRERFYEEATWTLEVDGLSPKETAQQILALLSE